MLQFEWWQGVDGGLFEGIDGTGVFLGVARPLCPRMLATVLMLAPLQRRLVPQL